MSIKKVLRHSRNPRKENKRFLRRPFPPMTQAPLEFVDMTPSLDLPLRILRAYRENCDCRWDVSGELATGNARLIYDAMNEHQATRARILDQAIGILEREMVGPKLVGV
jgi:hypothetical protein